MAAETFVRLLGGDGSQDAKEAAADKELQHAMAEMCSMPAAVRAYYARTVTDWAFRALFAASAARHSHTQPHAVSTAQGAKRTKQQQQADSAAKPDQPSTRKRKAISTDHASGDIATCAYRAKLCTRAVVHM